MLIVTDNILWCGINGSIINLAIIAVERYLKVVHANWSNLKLRNWMIYLAMAFAWIGSIIYCNALIFSTGTMINGVCYIMVFSSDSLKLFWFMWNFISFYVIILLIFIFCYGHILHLIRRQAKIMSSHSTTESNTSQTQIDQIQTNMIKTMILVCGFYAIMWWPNHIITLVMVLSPNPNHYYDSGYYASSLFLAFLYMCTNPFIYAIKFDPVKETLLRMIPCKKTSNPAAESVNTERQK